jgi:hypothetical protein
MAIERVTPKAVADLYAALSDDDKAAFRRALGKGLTAEHFVLLLGELPLTEQERFSRMIDQQFLTIAMPKLILEAIRVAREHPEAQEPELAKRVEQQATGYYLDIKKLAEAEAKQARDPKKRNVERDAEIIRLAKQGKTSGEIHRDIKARWKCTPGAVNQVMIRAKRTGQLPK